MAAEHRRTWIKAAVAGVLLVAALAVIVPQLWPRNDAAAATQRRNLVDAETGEVFADFRVPRGDREPYAHPRTGERTLYLAELCFWMRDGGVKLEPTYVLLNERVGKGGRTECPDCGRRVVMRNPEPPAELFVKLFGDD